MRTLHLFAGVGGGILGDLLLGHEPVAAVEINPFCREVLVARQRDGVLPQFPIFEDVRAFDGRAWKGLVDVVAGGFPCQDVSVSGRRRGLSGERSGLWLEMRRIIGEVEPRHVFVENVPGLLSCGIETVLGDLSALGFNAEWDVLGADLVGAAHHRDRLWILGEHPHRSDGDRADGSRGSGLRVEGRLGAQGCEDGRRGERELGAVIPSFRARSYADALRIASGIPGRLDRLRALGNSQVPAVVDLAWKTLSVAATGGEGDADA